MRSEAQTVRERLASPPKRGIGCANEVARDALANRSVLDQLVAALDDSNPVVISRAANALKKVQEQEPRALDPFARGLLRKALSCDVLEARWNLTIVAGGLRPRGRDLDLAIDLLFESLAGASVFLRVFALQALVDLSANEPALRRRVRPVLDDCLANGTPAMKARARKLRPLLDRRGV